MANPSAQSCTADRSSLSPLSKTYLDFDRALGSVWDALPLESGCALHRPEYQQGVQACSQQRKLWEADFKLCSDPGARRNPDRPEAMALRRELTKVVFDRELMLINRLPPVGKNIPLWDQFEAKWARVFREDPTLMKSDVSPLLKSEEQGALGKRMAALKTARERAAAAHQALGTQFGLGRVPEGGVYLLGTQLTRWLLDQREVMAFALEKAGGKKSDAREFITQEKDVLAQLYPEADEQEESLVRVRMELARKGWKTSRLIEEFLKKNDTGELPTLEQRTSKLIQISAQALSGPQSELGLLEEADEGLRREFKRLNQRLDEMLADSKSSPDGLFTQPGLYLAALQSLRPDEGSSHLGKSLLVRLCDEMAAQASDQEQRSKLARAGELVGDATLLLVGAGTVVSIGSRALIKVIPRAVASLSEASLLAHKTVMVTAVGGASLSGPTALVKLQGDLSKYQKRADEYYRSTGGPDATLESRLKATKEVAQWSSLNVMMNLVPLLFL